MQVRAMSRDEAIKFAKNPANHAMVAMIVLFLVAFLLYFLSAFLGYMTGANDPTSKTRMTIGEDGELVQSDSNAADSFQKI